MQKWARSPKFGGERLLFARRCHERVLPTVSAVVQHQSVREYACGACPTTAWTTTASTLLSYGHVLKMRICFHFHYKYWKVTISLEIYIFVISEQILMGVDVLTPVLCHLIVYDIILSMGDKTGNSINRCQIAMGTNVLRLALCPKVKLIDKCGVGENTGSKFESLYLGHLWIDFDEVWCANMGMT